MRLSDYPELEGQQVWLNQDEVDLFLDEAQSAEQRRAFLLGVRAGLRREEIVSVTVADFLNGPDGFVRVWSDYAKRDKYREAPIPDALEHTVSDLQYERDGDEPVVDVAGNTVYRWVRRAAERCQSKTNDKGWEHLGVHDLRRTWAGDLLWNQGLLPTSVMAFGGWESWDTFRDHYLGEMSPEAARRERGKISWAGSGREIEQAAPTVFEPRRGESGRSHSWP